VTSDISRRDALSIMAAAALGVAAPSDAATPSSGAAVSGGAAPADRVSHASDRAREPNGFRVRTLTAGTSLANFSQLDKVEAALDFLTAARKRFEAAGYEVQTTRIALNPLLVGVSPSARMNALEQLADLDKLVAAHGALLSIGPAFSFGDADDRIGEWATRLARTTKITSFSGSVASLEHGVHRDAVRMAAQVIAALANAMASGVANFRFAAAACIPAGTPFFPVAYHQGAASLAVGLETPNLLNQAFRGGGGGSAGVGVDASQASDRLRDLLNQKLQPVEKLARQIAEQGQRNYLGIDSSPAPGRDSSIGLALETLTGQPCGAASTLQACAAVTGAIKSLAVTTCGYSGLMLPILEDPVLAARVVEGRIKISDLLLYSTVCGTGLDLVPLPGDAPPTDLARVIGDVATLAVRLKKPLSARLFPVPGKKVGEPIEFSDPLLCPAIVMQLDG